MSDMPAMIYAVDVSSTGERLQRWFSSDKALNNLEPYTRTDLVMELRKEDDAAYKAKVNALMELRKEDDAAYKAKLNTLMELRKEDDAAYKAKVNTLIKLRKEDEAAIQAAFVDSANRVPHPLEARIEQLEAENRDLKQAIANLQEVRDDHASESY
mgnify:FL=1